jgi:prepilin-type N-terminal cleavage/methylation domain-containing protein
MVVGEGPRHGLIALDKETTMLARPQLSARAKAMNRRQRVFATITRDEDGFTLIEIVVSVAIVGIMLTVGIPYLIGILQGSNDSAAKQELNKISVAEQAYISQGGGAAGGDYGTLAQLTADPVASYKVGSDIETGTAPTIVTDNTVNGTWYAIVESKTKKFWEMTSSQPDPFQVRSRPGQLRGAAAGVCAHRIQRRLRMLADKNHDTPTHTRPPRTRGPRAAGTPQPEDYSMVDTATAIQGRNAGRVLGRGRQSAPAAVTEAPLRVADLIDRLLTQAAEIGASDLHIEPLPGGTAQIRLRIDGTAVDHRDAIATIDGQIRTVDEFPMQHLSQLRGRIASLADFSLDEHIPQNAGMDSPIKARVATVPTVDGVQMVLRLFPETKLHALEWHSGRDEKAWNDMVLGRGGLVLVSGPVGSGKSTTVFHALEKHVAAGRFVSTIEDPVEYRMLGAQQSPVTIRAGFNDILTGLARRSATYKPSTP